MVSIVNGEECYREDWGVVEVYAWAVPNSGTVVDYRGSQRDVVFLGLTNSALVYEPKCGGMGGSCGVSSIEYTVPAHMKPQ